MQATSKASEGLDWNNWVGRKGYATLVRSEVVPQWRSFPKRK